jgi:hypothetical protein
LFCFMTVLMLDYNVCNTVVMLDFPLDVGQLSIQCSEVTLNFDSAVVQSTSFHIFIFLENTTLFGK